MQQPPKPLPLWPHIVLAFFVFLSTSAGLGYRHLWVDELETAERARTIVTSGLPRTFDKAGNPSVATGGGEIEEGTLHRYTPWAQYYAAAAGLAIGHAVHASEDKAVRMPFLAAHALTGGAISYGLAALTPASLPVAVLTGLAFSWQTERIVHNRTARYHALIDLFLVLGLLGIGAMREKKKWGPALAAAAIFILPQVQTVAGSLFSLLLGLIFLYTEWNTSGFNRKTIQHVFLWAVLPGVLSLLVIFFLCRPGEQVVWGVMRELSLGFTLKMRKRLFYAFYFILLSAALLAVLRHFRRAWQLASVFALVLIVCMALDRHPYSQYRYYIATPLLFLLWPMALGLADLPKWARRAIPIAILVFTLIPELTTRRFTPFQGLRLVYHDWKDERAGVKQPIHEVVAYLTEQAKPGDPTLFDYTPQFANWYLPGLPIPLMPDALYKTALNKDNPVWERPVQLPKWHIWYPERKTESPQDKIRSYNSQIVAEADGVYLFTSETHGQTQRMCVVRTWETNRFNNAPFELYKDASFTPAGDPQDTLILAKRCEAD